MILENEIALGGAVAPPAYQVERSLRFNSADSAYLAWQPPQAGNRRTWTYSTWIKRSALGDKKIFCAGTGTTDSTFLNFFFGSADNLRVSGYATDWLITTQVFRDLSAFYHIMLVADTDNATAANRLRLYVNGSQITAFSTATYPTGDLGVNNTQQHNIGRSTAGTNYNDCYCAETYFIDGLALDPTSFGEFNSSTGVWSPLAYTGSYGNNGFYLPFNDNSTVLNLGRNRQTLTADPYFPVTTLLLNGNGTNGAQNNTFLDSSTNNFTITRNGNTTQGTFSPFSQTGWSNYFSGGYFTAPANAAFSFPGDFTIECWINAPSLSSSNSLWIMDVGGSSYLAFNPSATGVDVYLNSLGVSFTATASIATNAWVHLALVRSGSTVRVYVNGTQATNTGTTSATLGSSGATFRIGGFTGGFTGYISNFRVVKSAVYTSNFTPSSTPLTAITNTSLLTLQDNRIVDNSTNAFAITVASGTPSVQAFSPFAPSAAYSAATVGGSGYFDGTGDFLSIPDSTSLTIGTNNFTVEAWVYAPSTAANFAQLCGQRDSAGSANANSPFGIFKNNTGPELSFSYWNGSSNVTGTGTIPVFNNAWHHVALVRNGTDLRLYVDGVSSVAVTLTGGFSFSDSNTIFAIGRAGAFDGQYWTGYINGFRFVNGTAVYTSAFTPPTAPPTAITNTSLLLNFTNGGIIDATGKNVLETVGNAKISTTQSKWGGSSISVDGAAGSYVAFPTNINTLLHQIGDWAYDCWVYYNAVPSTGFQNIFGQGGAGQNSYGRTVSGSKFVVNQANLGNRITGTTTVTTGVWYHVAVARIGGVIRLYVNGVSEGGTYSDSTNYAFGNLPVTIGSNMNGYINDFRFTRLSRYTGNFTPPVAQFAYNTADINVKQWVPTNFSVTAGVGNDSLVDSPTNYGTDTGAGGEVRGNYATLNPLKNGGGALSNGNLDQASSVNNTMVLATIGMQSGKWYWEVTGGTVYGIAQDNVTLGNYIGQNANSWGYHQGGTVYTNTVSTAYGNTWTGTDVIGIAFDADNGRVFFSKNGVWQNSGNPATGTNPAYSSLTNGPYFPAVQTNSGATSVANFGQRPFAYTAPSGFKALCTTNLPTPAIGASAGTLASKNMNVVTYTGDGTSPRTVSGFGFQPDFVWVKNRSISNAHTLHDVLRGAGTNKALYSNATVAETSGDTNLYGYLSAFTTDGFSATAGTGATPQSYFNTSGNGYVGWAWKANGAGVSNTAGSISSTVSANTAAGISVVSFTGNGVAGATVGHGLGVAPRLVILKSRSVATTDWRVWHAALGNARMILNDTSAAVTDNGVIWGNGSTYTAPSSSVLTVSANSSVNGNGSTYVAYCFAEVAGFSKFGSYVGNGSADGPFVYCGFRPRWIMYKASSGTSDWVVIDTTRDDFNVADSYLLPNSSAAEATSAIYDVLSNGFKCRSATFANTSAVTYIFAAFAEAPFNYARAR